MATERELKFSLLESTFPLVEDLKAVFKKQGYVLEPPDSRHIHDIYFDTPKGTLRKANMALRQRTVNGRQLATLKREQLTTTDVPLQVSDELELPLEDDGWPYEIRRAVAEVAPLLTLRMFVDINIHRVSYVVSRLGRALAVISFDDVSVMQRNTEVTAHFAEVEIEALGKTSTDKLTEFADIVMQTADITPCFVNKLQRSLALLDLAETLEQGF
ncbi:MAG: CYTH domain-containing protein [Deinococcota bacterium]